MKISEMTQFASTLDGSERFEMSKEYTAWETFSLELADLTAYFSDVYVGKAGGSPAGYMFGDLVVEGSGGPGTGAVGIQISGSQAGSNFIWLRSNANAAYNATRASGNDQGIFNTYEKSRGTLSSLADVVVNDWGLRFGVNYYGGGDHRSSGRLQHVCIEPTPSSTAMGGRWAFWNAPLGSISLTTENVRFEYDTGISMYGANPVIDNNRLHRLRSYTVAGLPTAGIAGRKAYASNLRVFNGAGTQEGAGAGTGGEVVDNGTNWKIAGTNVTAIA